MTEPDLSTSRKRTRRWFLGVVGGAGVLAALYGLGRTAFRVWMSAALPEDAPRIAFSLDDTWLNELGITDTTYQHAMTRAGAGLERFLPSSSPPAADLLDKHAIDGLLLTGGGDVDPALYGGDASEAILVNRERDEFEIALIRAALDRGIPVLGICRGCQIINVAFEGTLRNLRNNDALNQQHFTFAGHPVQLDPESRLARLLDTQSLEEVLSFHGQAVAEPGSGLRVAARGPSDVIEAVETLGNYWVTGVQWHPEMAPGNPVHARLFEAFVTEARRAKNPAGAG